jgi:hypothetical protein
MKMRHAWKYHYEKEPCAICLCLHRSLPEIRRGHEGAWERENESGMIVLVVTE